MASMSLGGCSCAPHRRERERERESERERARADRGVRPRSRELKTDCTDHYVRKKTTTAWDAYRRWWLSHQHVGNREKGQYPCPPRGGGPQVLTRHQFETPVVTPVTTRLHARGTQPRTCALLLKGHGYFISPLPFSLHMQYFNNSIYSFCTSTVSTIHDGGIHARDAHSPCR